MGGSSDSVGGGDAFLGVGMPERQKSNREVARRQRKKQKRHRPAGQGTLLPLEDLVRREEILGLARPC